MNLMSIVSLSQQNVKYKVQGGPKLQAAAAYM